MVLHQYEIIYADPPWEYKVWNEDKKLAHGVAKRHYQTMNIKDICRLPIKFIANDNCKLFLWMTPPCLSEALQVIKAWGFEYRTIAFAWVKINKRQSLEQSSFLPVNSIDDSFGIGHWTASNIELCLGALRPGGVLNRQSKSVRQIVLAPGREHSRKPDEVRDRIVELLGDLPRIELFAREKAGKWDAWGDEVESDIDLYDLQQMA